MLARLSSLLFPAEKQDEFPALTGIRAIAAYLVFFHHFSPQPDWAGQAAYRIAAEGHTGVTVFFVLSGFLIAWNYFDKSESKGGFWGPYIVKRIARIQPVYLLLLLTWYLSSSITGFPQSSGWILLANVTLAKGLLETIVFTGIPQAWTLTVEEMFYLNAPWIFSMIRRRGLVFAQIALWLAGAAAAALCMWAGFFGGARFAIANTFFGRSFEFVVGIACALWLRKRRPAASRHAVRTWIGLAGFAGSLAWMTTFATHQDFGVGHPVGRALNNLAMPLFLGSLFLGLVLERSLAASVLSSRWFVLLGRSSYVFYLLHVGPGQGVVQDLLARWPAPARLAAGFAAANAASILIYLSYERPANAWVRATGMRWLGHSSSIAAAWRPLAAGLALLSVWTGLAFSYRARDDERRAANTRLRLPGCEALEAPAHVRSGFGPVTSDVSPIPKLRRTVGAEPLGPNAYIFAHANSRIAYSLEPGRWKKLSFSMGLDDAGGADAGSVVYAIIGDGRQLFRSGAIRSLHPPQPVTVSIEGVRQLELKIDDAGDGIHSDESYWIAPRLE